MNLMFAIDLLWVRYGKIGGGVAVVFNLLDGLLQLNDQFKAYLVLTEDNVSLFSKYTNDSRFELIVAKGSSSNRWKTIMLQNGYLGRVLNKYKIPVCLETDNYMPLIYKGKSAYVTVINDLQALHYPEFFTLKKRLWLNANWKNVMKHSQRILTISDYTRLDVIRQFNVDENRVSTVYVPVVVKDTEVTGFDHLSQKYNISQGKYYYTVSSMGKNKNLITLLDMMAVLLKRGVSDKRLVISGVSGGKSIDQFNELLRERQIENNVVLTGFVDNIVRNTLYKNCEAFLFPSIFEGFGMPPVEARLFGAKVITTKETCIPEVTQNALIYVDNAYDANEWADRVLRTDENIIGEIDFNRYDIRVIAKEYLNAIKDASPF